MTISETIFQCENCLRYFLEGKVVSVSFSEGVAAVRDNRLKLGICSDPDCMEVMNSNLSREKEKRNRCQARKAAGLPAVRSFPRVVRSSCPPEPDEPDAHQAPPAAMPRGEVVTSLNFSQQDFEAAGEANSANARLIDFFLRPHNFGKWFKSTDLEKFCKSSRMNNRARDLRPHFISMGLYVDNAMIRPNPDAPMSSHYRLCKIEDALSLSVDAKRKLINEVTF